MKNNDIKSKLIKIMLVLLIGAIVFVFFAFRTNYVFYTDVDDAYRMQGIDKPLSVSTLVEKIQEFKLETPEDTTDEEPQTETPEVTGSGKTIYVDAGHGCRYRQGSPGPYGWTTVGANGEADYAEEIRIQLSDALNAKGYTVKAITDLTYNGVQGSREEFGNKGRVLLMMNNPVDMCIQIHYDDSINVSSTGGHIIYGSTSQGSMKLAQGIATAFAAHNIRINSNYPGGISDRAGNLAVYSTSTSKPFILVECGFGAPGKADYAVLRDPTYKKQMIDAICEGVDAYYN